MTMLTSHPADARYFSSRATARDACRPGERVIRLGYFARGSFGQYGRINGSGQPVGGPDSRVCVWMVTKS